MFWEQALSLGDCRALRMS